MKERKHLTNVRKLLVLVSVFAVAPLYASWSTSSNFKCPALEVRLLIGFGLEFCVPQDVYHCLFTDSPMALARGMERRRRGLPGACQWCFDACFILDLVFYESRACYRFGGDCESPSQA